MKDKMRDEQYDVSIKMKKLFEIKQKQRAAAKEYFQNYIYNPHRPPSDGIPFDPALQRFGAMCAYHAENFRPTPKIWFQYSIFLLPVVLMTMGLTYKRNNREKLLRSGVVKYADREMKLLM